MSANRRVIIIGALSTMAMHTCRLLAAEGASMALLARNETRLADLAQDLRVRGAAKVTTFASDLEACPDHAAALAQATDAIGGADVIAIFYGYLGEQSRAETDLNEAQHIISANFSSAASWALAGADLLVRQGKQGTLLGISSVAGDRGRRSNYVYGAAKAGFSVLMQGIAHRFAALPNGPTARVIKFGFVDTAMTAGITKGGPLWASPDAAAQSVRRAFDHGGPIVYAPWFWRWVMLILRCLPAPIFNRVNI
jgi:decaprenylphospho-beta-D-erythro-pentofuranosid-2-ulose 2-reductase